MKLMHPVVREHPLHAMLSDLPAGLIPAALVAAALHRARPSARRRYASDGAVAAATVTAATAGAIGWWDWLTIPGEHAARRPATIHGLINSAGLVGLAAAMAVPRRRVEILAAVTGALLVAAWIGGDLVYKLGWRVRPAEELEVMDARLRERGLTAVRDDARRVVDAHQREETFLPDPTSR